MAKNIIKITERELNEVVNEGIDFDPKTKTVAYNPSHESIWIK